MPTAIKGGYDQMGRERQRAFVSSILQQVALVTLPGGGRCKPLDPGPVFQKLYGFYKRMLAP